MPDISMCRGKGCPVSHRCYRALASPGVMQSYSNFDELRVDGTPCNEFWDVSHDDLQDNGFPLVTEKDNE
jgi:hypothetical protein